MEQEFKIEVIKSIKRLPTLPIIFEKVLETIDDPMSSARILEDTIKNDQSISAKVLSMANSAYYGYSKRVSDLSRAIVILGFDMVKNIALSVSVFGMFPQDNEDTHFDKSKFWLHSIGCGYMGKIIANTIDYYEPDKAFIACLLHDIGKVVLSSHFEKDFLDAIDLMKKNDITLREAEKEIFDFDHSEVGNWLGEKWDFPEELLGAIKYHHSPSLSPKRHKQLTYITYVSNIIIQEEEIGVGGSKLPVSYEDDAKRILQLDSSKLKAVREEITGMREKLETLLQVMS
ncbi:HDOD domain-containing protein [candidate division KSB1 bacterium]